MNVEQKRESDKAAIARLLPDVAENEVARIFREIKQPNWNPAPCGDWVRYVPGKVRDSWESLSVESKIVAYLCAESRLDGEICSL